MKRIALILLVAAIGGVLLANYRITSEVQAHLEDTQRALSLFGAFSYGPVSVTPMGTLRVKDLTFSPHSEPDEYRVDEVRLETAHLLELYRLAFDLERRQIPQKMQLTVAGLHLDLNTGFLRSALGESSNNDLWGQLESAGCGERRGFDAADYIAMGYGLMVSDITLGYQLTHSGTRALITFDMTTRHMMRMHTELAIDINSDMGLKPDTFALARLNSASARLVDLGFNQARNQFCAREAGVTTAEFDGHHLDAWLNTWQRHALAPGDSLVSAYQQYSRGQGHTLTLNVEPFPGLGAEDMAMSLNPDYLSGRLNPTVAINGQAARPFSISAALPDPAIAEELRAGAGETQLPAATRRVEAPSSSSAGNPRVVTRQLDQHLNRDVRLTLTDGRRMDGRVSRVENGTLHLNRRLHGGNMEVPVPLSQIREARLL